MGITQLHLLLVTNYKHVKVYQYFYLCQLVSKLCHVVSAEKKRYLCQPVSNLCQGVPAKTGTCASLFQSCVRLCQLKKGPVPACFKVVSDCVNVFPHRCEQLSFSDDIYHKINNKKMHGHQTCVSLFQSCVMLCQQKKKVTVSTCFKVVSGCVS